MLKLNCAPIPRKQFNVFLQIAYFKTIEIRKYNLNSKNKTIILIVRFRIQLRFQ